MGLLIFSHGNSFPASTYGVMTVSLKKRGFKVKAIEKFGHDSNYPVSDNWTHLVQQLADFTRRESDKAGEAATLVGHSLGGILSLMCAARHPAIVRGLVMVDSPLIGGWRAGALGAIKSTGTVGHVSPGVVSQRRKNSWDSVDAAFDFFKTKRSFGAWDDAVLRDYVEHGTELHNGKRVLCFSREVETQIYNTLPHNLDSLLRRKPLQCPAAFIGGLQSAEMQRIGTSLTEKLVKGRMQWLDGTHLFPMEKPLATAAAIETAIRGFNNNL